jgi:hypothetical protein
MPTKRTQFGHRDGEPFIAALEQAQGAGHLDHVEANLPRLECLIARLQNRQIELAELQYRACQIRDMYEPRATRR